MTHCIWCTFYRPQSHTEQSLKSIISCASCWSVFIRQEVDSSIQLLLFTHFNHSFSCANENKQKIVLCTRCICNASLKWNRRTFMRNCNLNAHWRKKREIESEKNPHRSKYRKSTFQCIAAFSTWKWIVQNKKIKLTHIQTEIEHTHTHALSLNPMCSERKYRKKSVCV